MRMQAWMAAGATWPHCCCCCCCCSTLTAGLLDWRHNGVWAALLYIWKSQMCFYLSAHTSSDSLLHTHADRRTYVFFVVFFCLWDVRKTSSFYPFKKKNFTKNRSCALLFLCDASPLLGSVIMESLPGHFFSLFFIWSNYRWRGKRCFFSPFFYFLHPTFLPLPACIQKSSHWRILIKDMSERLPQHVVSSDRPPPLLFVSINKPSKQG